MATTDPPLTQASLRNCVTAQPALPDELLKLRTQLRKFPRDSLTEQAQALKSAKSRGDKREVCRESEKAWATLLEKQDRSTRISHQIWDITKNPLKAPFIAVDKAIERDKLDQAILKVQGLTDLWRTPLRCAHRAICRARLRSLQSGVSTRFWKQFSSI